MTSKLIASGLAAAFSLGTALGVTVTQTPSKPINDTPSAGEPFYKDATQRPEPKILYLDSPARKAQPQIDDELVCKEIIPGERQCWPKNMAPDESQDTTCYGTEERSFCYSTPKRNGPELEI